MITDEGKRRFSALTKKKKKKPPLGSGERFAQLKAELAQKGEARNPDALAAWIGRQKYGKKKFSQLSHHGK